VNAGYRDTGFVFRVRVGAPQPVATGTIAGTLRLVGGPAPGLGGTIPGSIYVERRSATGHASLPTDGSCDPAPRPYLPCYPTPVVTTTTGYLQH
jgi:hypothetical protein